MSASAMPDCEEGYYTAALTGTSTPPLSWQSQQQPSNRKNTEDFCLLQMNVVAENAESAQASSGSTQQILGLAPPPQPNSPVDAGGANGAGGGGGVQNMLGQTELGSADLNLIRIFLRSVRAQREAAVRAVVAAATHEQQQQQQQSTAAATGSMSASARIQPVEPAENIEWTDEVYLEPVLKQLKSAHVPVHEILQEHPKSLGMLVKFLQSHPENNVAELARSVYDAWLPKVMAASKVATATTATTQPAPQHKTLLQSAAVAHSHTNQAAEIPPAATAATALPTKQHMTVLERVQREQRSAKHPPKQAAQRCRANRPPHSMQRAHITLANRPLALSSPTSFADASHQQQQQQKKKRQPEMSVSTAGGRWHSGVGGVGGAAGMDSKDMSCDASGGGGEGGCNAVDIEQFEALAADGAWYDARILNLVELKVGLESNRSNHKVRVQYQNCNPGIAEDLPVRHVRRRSEAFRAGQVPQVGKMVLAFQQRKSYDLYYDAEVLQVKASATAEVEEVLVQYLHGPEEGMQEWLPLHSLHRIRQQPVSFTQLKAMMPILTAGITVETSAIAATSSHVLDVEAKRGKGPPYVCCIQGCGKSFQHPPAHSSHEKAHLALLQPQSFARSRRVVTDTTPALQSKINSKSKVPIKMVGDEIARHGVEKEAVGEIEMKDAFSAEQETPDMRQILLTWRTADEKHIRFFKKRLRQKHPDVSADAKMCSDTCLLVEGSGLISRKVMIDEKGNPTLCDCTEKERALTIHILRRQAETRQIAVAELKRARMEYSRFQLPLTLEDVRDLGQQLRSDTLLPDANKCNGEFTFSTIGGRWWAPSLDPLLEAFHASAQKKADGVLSQRHRGTPLQARASRLQQAKHASGSARVVHAGRAHSHLNVKRKGNNILERPFKADMDGMCLKRVGGGFLVPADLKLDGLKAYVNGTGANGNQELRGFLVKPPGEKVLRIMVGGDVISLSDFCAKAGNTARRVQQSIMVANTEPPICLAEWIARNSRSCSQNGKVEGSSQNGKVEGRANFVKRDFVTPTAPTEKRIRGIRLPLESGDTGDVEQEEGGGVDGKGKAVGFKTSGSLYVGLRILLPPPVNSRGHRDTNGGKEGGTEGRMGLGEADNVANEVCNQELTMRKMGSDNTASLDKTEKLKESAVWASVDGQMIGAVITHWMPAKFEEYVSATWGCAAALWQCKRDDGSVEHLEEDEVRTALYAAGMSDADMPPLEDRSHNAWKQEIIGGRERGAGKEDDSGKLLNASSLLRGRKLAKLHVKNKEMQPAVLLAISIIGSLKSTAFASNGLLSSRDGRQRWKKIVCGRDLSKFGKSIKSLETNLVWSAVTEDFDKVRQQLLKSIQNLSTVEECINALKLLDNCILDSFRRKNYGRQNDDDSCLSYRGPGDDGDDDDRQNQRSLHSRPTAGIEASRNKAVRLVGNNKDDCKEMLCPQPDKLGKELVGRKIRVRTKCDVSGRFSWLDAKVVGYQVRHDVPIHCIETLGSGTVAAVAHEPLWMNLKRGNYTLIDSSRSNHKRKVQGEEEGRGKESGDMDGDVIQGIKRSRHDAIERKLGKNPLMRRGPDRLLSTSESRVRGKGRAEVLVQGGLLKRDTPGADKELLRLSPVRKQQRGRPISNKHLQHEGVADAAMSRNGEKEEGEGGVSRSEGGGGENALDQSARKRVRVLDEKRAVPLVVSDACSAPVSAGKKVRLLGGMRKPSLDLGATSPINETRAAVCTAEEGEGEAHVYANSKCTRCGSASEEDSMLLCDRCDAGWHMDCLPVPLDRVPEGTLKTGESNVHVRRDRARQHRETDDTRLLFRVGCNTKKVSAFSKNLKATSSNTTTTAARHPHPHPPDAGQRNAAGETVKEGDKSRRCDSKDAGSSSSGSSTSQSWLAGFAAALGAIPAWAGCEDGLRNPHSLEANGKREADGGHTGKRNVINKEGRKFKFGKEVRGDTKANGGVGKKRLGMGMHARTVQPTTLVPMSGLHPVLKRPRGRPRKISTSTPIDPIAELQAWDAPPSGGEVGRASAVARAEDGGGNEKEVAVRQEDDCKACQGMHRAHTCAKRLATLLPPLLPPHSTVSAEMMASSRATSAFDRTRPEAPACAAPSALRKPSGLPTIPRKRAKNSSVCNGASAQGGKAGGDEIIVAGNGEGKDVVVVVHLAEDVMCVGCSSRKRARDMLLCDGCDAGWHIDCLAVPLTEVPKGRHWFCDHCKLSRKGQRRWCAASEGELSRRTEEHDKNENSTYDKDGSKSTTNT